VFSFFENQLSQFLNQLSQFLKTSSASFGPAQPVLALVHLSTVLAKKLCLAF
jgi:hypothetical protein